MKIRITKVPKPKYQTKGPVDEDDSWIRKILEYEAMHGSSSGSGLKNWGYNSRIPLDNQGNFVNPNNPATNKPWTIDDAVGFYKQDFLPKLQQYPMGLRERAGDFMYNTGVDPRIYLLDQYITQNEKGMGLPGRSLYKSQGLNSPQFEKIYSQYQSKIDALPIEERVKLMDAGRDYYYKNINTVDGKPNSAYEATWKPRVNMWGQYNPSTQQQTVVAQKPAATQTAVAQKPAGQTASNQNDLIWGSTIPGVVTKEESINAFGECGPGMVFSELKQTCISEQEANQENQAMGAFRNFMDKKRKGLPTNPFKTTGNEGTASNPMGVTTQTMTASSQPKTAYAKGYDFVMDPFRKFQKKLQSPFMQDVYGAASVVNGLVDLATPVATYFDNLNKINNSKQVAEINRYNSYNSAPKFRGNFTINEGLFRPDQKVVNEGMYSNNFSYPTMAAYGGPLNDPFETIDPMKIRIKKVPTMAYGGQTNYGLDLGRRNVYSEMPESSSEGISNSMSEINNPDEDYVLEAERDETIWRPDGTHFFIGGEKHYNNGTKLTGEQAPPNSYIFSEKLKLKDPAMLKMFGMDPSKSHSFAKIAKKFKLNDYKARLEDPLRQSDSISMRSDKLMHDKNSASLAKLSAVMENMKGKPAPKMSEALLGMTEMAYGGYHMPKFQGVTGSSQVGSKLGEWSDDYEKLSALLMDPKNAGLRKTMFAEFLKDYPNSPLKGDPEGEKKFVDNFLNAQQQFMGIRAKYKDKPEELTTEAWDAGGKNARYNKIAKELGYTPMSENDIKRFQGGYRALAKAVQKNPEFIESFGKYFDLTPLGVKDEEFMGWPISKDDAWVGNTTLGQVARLRNEKPKDPGLRYECDPATGKARIVAAGGYSSPEEAERNCPAKTNNKPKYICVNGKVILSPSGIGYDDPDVAGQNCGTTPGDVPFDYLLPDKMNLAYRANAVIPNIYMPELEQLPRRRYPMAFDDWMARAQNRQSTYNAAMDTAARTNQSQAVGSFLAGIVGNQDVGDIAQVNAANVDRAERRTLADMETDFKTDLFNLGERKDYRKGVVTAQQQYDNTKYTRMGDLVQAYADAWEHRGDLYDINARNPFFYRSPQSYKTIFKGPAGGFSALGKYGPGNYGGMGYGTNGAGGIDNLGDIANNYYKSYYESLSDVKDEKVRSQMAANYAKAAINSRMQTSTQSYDQYGMPRTSSSRRSMFNFDDDDE